MMPPRSDQRAEDGLIVSHHVQAMFIFFRLFPRGRSPLARQGQGDSSQGAHKPPAFTSGLSRAKGSLGRTFRLQYAVHTCQARFVHCRHCLNSIDYNFDMVVDVSMLCTIGRIVVQQLLESVQDRR